MFFRIIFLFSAFFLSLVFSCNEDMDVHNRTLGTTHSNTAQIDSAAKSAFALAVDNQYVGTNGLKIMSWQQYDSFLQINFRCTAPLNFIGVAGEAPSLANMQCGKLALQYYRLKVMEVKSSETMGSGQLTTDLLTAGFEAASLYVKNFVDKAVPGGSAVYLPPAANTNPTNGGFSVFLPITPKERQDFLLVAKDNGANFVGGFINREKERQSVNVPTRVYRVRYTSGLIDTILYDETNKDLNKISQPDLNGPVVKIEGPTFTVRVHFSADVSKVITKDYLTLFSNDRGAIQTPVSYTFNATTNVGLWTYNVVSGMSRVYLKGYWRSDSAAIPSKSMPGDDNLDGCWDTTEVNKYTPHYMPTDTCFKTVDLGFQIAGSTTSAGLPWRNGPAGCTADKPCCKATTDGATAYVSPQALTDEIFRQLKPTPKCTSSAINWDINCTDRFTFNAALRKDTSTYNKKTPSLKEKEIWGTLAVSVADNDGAKVHVSGSQDPRAEVVGDCRKESLTQGLFRIPNDTFWEYTVGSGYEDIKNDEVAAEVKFQQAIFDRSFKAAAPNPTLVIDGDPKKKRVIFAGQTFENLKDQALIGVAPKMSCQRGKFKSITGQFDFKAYTYKLGVKDFCELSGIAAQPTSKQIGDASVTALAKSYSFDLSRTDLIDGTIDPNQCKCQTDPFVFDDDTWSADCGALNQCPGTSSSTSTTAH